MVAAPNPYDDNQPDIIIADICDALVTADNQLSVQAVVRQYQTWLAAHPRTVVAETANVARSQVQSFFRRHQPKVGKHGQLSMYFPDDWVPIGSGKRARMRNLTDAQLVLWGQELDKAHASTVAAYEAKKSYIAERHDRFGRYAILDDLERGEFGYVDLDTSYGEDIDDEDDDDD